MGLALSEDQLILKATARSYLDDKSPVSRMRELRDSQDATGFSRALWKEMAEMGWTGILFPEEYGGAGGTFAARSTKRAGGARVYAAGPGAWRASAGHGSSGLHRVLQRGDARVRHHRPGDFLQ